MHVSDSAIEITHNGAGETAQWLRPWTALAEDPSANTVTQTTCNSSSRGSSHLLTLTGAHSAHIYMSCKNK